MIVDLQGSERWQVIAELIDRLVADGKVAPPNREVIAAAVRKRELAMSTGIGLGIGLPHATTDLVSEVVYVIGRSAQGIAFDSADRQPVYTVCLFLVPIGQFQQHLHLLAHVAKILQHTSAPAQIEAELARLIKPH